jgi:hypothetical protein
MDSINNLKDVKVYLVGAMDRVHDGGVTWRQELTPILKQIGIKVIDPCKKPIITVREDEETRWWIDYYKETVKNLDSMLYGVRNKLQIEQFLSGK